MTNDDSDEQRMPDRRYIQPPEERPNPRPRRRLPAIPPHAQGPPEQPGINLELHPVQPPQPGIRVILPQEEDDERPPAVPPRSPRPPQPSPNPQPRRSPRSSRSLLAPGAQEEGRGNNSDNPPENGQEDS